ncbi:hypothetical protein UCRNP2_8431 [Neofusicoccum parvum UCRNP2]|uniref:Uncharacterized protein n=1 Tax=Botryosphaeria parva (strain UCR-NP2) TaxID=1287680 RepID=R1G9J3_BOTPV|nr:hypothetical protein UCRNP2_8431 [Neofusicoccum parvum UCRNP2]
MEECCSEQEWYEPWDGPEPLEEGSPPLCEPEDAAFIDPGSETGADVEREREQEQEPELELEPELEQPERSPSPSPERDPEPEPEPSPNPSPSASPSPDDSPDPSPQLDPPPPKNKTPLHPPPAQPRTPLPAQSSYSLRGSSLSGAVHAMPRRADFQAADESSSSSSDAHAPRLLGAGKKVWSEAEIDRLADVLVGRGDEEARRRRERVGERKLEVLRGVYGQVVRENAERERGVAEGGAEMEREKLSRAQKKRLKRQEEAARKKAMKEAEEEREEEEKRRRKAASAAREGGGAVRQMASVQKVAGGRRQAKKRPGARKAGRKDGEKGPDGVVVTTTTTEEIEETEKDDRSRGSVALMAAAMQNPSEDGDGDTEDDEDTQVDIYKLLQLRSRALFGRPEDEDATETGEPSRPALRRTASMEAVRDVEQDNEVLSDDDKATVEEVRDE